MLLAIDIGNTHISVGTYKEATLVADFRLSTDHRRTEDEYGVLLDLLLKDAGINLHEVGAVVIASVVPPLSEVLKRMVVRRTGVEPLLVEPGVKTGMPVLYDNPREVGADRIVNGVAAYERFRDEPGGPHGVIVVDFGTATTFDLVSPRGEYMGGAIAPGVKIAADALFERAAKLPRVDLVLPPSAVGKTTIASMQSGILYGYAGLVDGMVSRMRAELSFEVRVIATGGLASLIAGCTQVIEAVDDYLTLEGLRIIHGRNPGGVRA
ncbi:MAG: pantothenate kinase [Deltaproteobacteria bacterium RIFOXYA12_FULL_58_15]|nr:MAG: pantothenate kinase [Deltaproteobacteria bacterium RIFOXYA12_FULL_58_15]